MGKARSIKIGHLAVGLLILTLAASCASVDDLEALKKLRYEAGSQNGAKFCATCHETIYSQWSTRSRHALATTSPSFHRAMNSYSENFFVGQFMDEALCYSCHGKKNVNEGVNCETCHGAVLRGAAIEKTHEKKFTPRSRSSSKAQLLRQMPSVMDAGVGGHVIVYTHRLARNPGFQTGRDLPRLPHGQAGKRHTCLSWL